MKNLLKLTTFLCFTSIIFGCTVESLNDTSTSKSIVDEVVSSNQICTNQNPQSRLVNNGTIPFTFIVIDSDDNTAQIQSIAPGTTSTFITFSEGETLFAIESNENGIIDSKVLLNMSTCTEVDIVVNSNNTIIDPVIQTVN